MIAAFLVVIALVTVVDRFYYRFPDSGWLADAAVGVVIFGNVAFASPHCRCSLEPPCRPLCCASSVEGEVTCFANWTNSHCIPRMQRIVAGSGAGCQSGPQDGCPGEPLPEGKPSQPCAPREATVGDSHHLSGPREAFLYNPGLSRYPVLCGIYRCDSGGGNPATPAAASPATPSRYHLAATVQELSETGTDSSSNENGGIRRLFEGLSRSEAGREHARRMLRQPHGAGWRRLPLHDETCGTPHAKQTVG